MGNQQSDISQGARNSGSIKSRCDEPPSYLISLSEKLVEKTKEKENLVGISENIFLIYVCDTNKSLGHELFQHWKQQEEDQSQSTLSSKAFINEGMKLLDLITDGDQLEYFIKVYSKDSETIDHTTLYGLVNAAYQVAQSVHPSWSLPDNILAGLVKAAMHNKSSVNCKYLHTWMCENCPRLVSWLHRYFSHTLTVAHHSIETLEEENEKMSPVLECGTDSDLKIHPAIVWLLSCTLPHMYIKNQSLTQSPSLTNLRNPKYIMRKLMESQNPRHWSLLYHSAEHGLSINRFQHHVFSYNGPTLLIITTDDDNMFCVACDEEWKDSKHFWGGPYCSVLQLLPQYKVVESGAKMMYFNLTSRGFPTGFQIGTDCKNRSITIDTDLSIVQYKRIPYKLKELELWGCGSMEIRETQQEIKKLERKDVEKARKVNLNSVDWVDNPDRLLLQMAGGGAKYATYDKNTQSHASTP